MILDGLVLHGKTFAAYLAGPEMRALAVKRKLTLPTLADVADVDPVPAWIQQGYWVATCPDCAHRPENELQAVWVSDPLLMFCTVCGNASAGGKLRPVALPERADAIAAVLAARPIAARTWMPPETVRDLAAENVLRGLPVPDNMALDE